MESTPSLLLLEDGSVFEGRAVCPGTRFGEVVFNTSMTGYQEILTDPSYRGQIVVMTCPEIGNVGTNPLDPNDPPAPAPEVPALPPGAWILLIAVILGAGYRLLGRQGASGF